MKTRKRNKLSKRITKTCTIKFLCEKIGIWKYETLKAKINGVQKLINDDMKIINNALKEIQEANK